MSLTRMFTYDYSLIRRQYITRRVIYVSIPQPRVKRLPHNSQNTSSLICILTWYKKSSYVLKQISLSPTSYLSLSDQDMESARVLRITEQTDAYIGEFIALVNSLPIDVVDDKEFDAVESEVQDLRYELAR